MSVKCSREYARTACVSTPGVHSSASVPMEWLWMLQEESVLVKINKIQLDIWTQTPTHTHTCTYMCTHAPADSAHLLGSRVVFLTNCLPNSAKERLSSELVVSFLSSLPSQLLLCCCPYALGCRIQAELQREEYLHVMGSCTPFLLALIYNWQIDPYRKPPLMSGAEIFLGKGVGGGES